MNWYRKAQSEDDFIDSILKDALLTHEDILMEKAQRDFPNIFEIPPPPSQELIDKSYRFYEESKVKEALRDGPWEVDCFRVPKRDISDKMDWFWDDSYRRVFHNSQNNTTPVWCLKKKGT
jgi:hypothetical protein